jgi:hypothetical protein
MMRLVMRYEICYDAKYDALRVMPGSERIGEANRHLTDA